MSGNPCGNQNNKSLYEMPTTFVIKHEPNNSDYIAKSSLPPLPPGWSGPWEYHSDYTVWGVLHGIYCEYAKCNGPWDAQFLRTILNITHPWPTKKKV